MNLRFAKAASIIAFGSVLAGFAPGQTYRQNFPLPDGSDFSGLGINLNIPDPTEAQVQQIQDAGFKFIRYELTWSGIELAPGVFNWTTADRFMAKAQAHGCRVMALLAYSNELYTTSGAPNTASSRAAFARYAAAAVARYKGKGVIWEIYNEPNLAGWWVNPNPADYAALVNETAPAMRAVASEEWIVGLSTQAPLDWMLPYVSSVLEGGILAHLDGVSFHPYTMSTPESAPVVGAWNTARALIEAERPVNRPIAMLTGEVGYSRLWTGISADMQATLTTRTVLVDLCHGVGFNNLFSYDDAAGTSDWHGHCGMVTRGTNIPYPVYNATKRMTGSLGGYKFSKRLTLPNANDYCMLFAKPGNANDCKLVVWTTDAPHSVSVPSSAVGFSSLALTSGATGSKTATTTGLSVSATGEATVYTSLSANPLLAIAGNWAKLPSSLTLSTRADAVSQLGSLVVSPAWAAMPAGATLKVEDLATIVPGYVRPSYTATLTGLPSLTLASASVQTLFNSLGALQDASGRARTLRLIVQLPDGSSVTQLASVARRQPMDILPTTPSNWALTLRVENPTGDPFGGTVRAISGALTVPQPLTFVQGETFKMMYFPTLPMALIGSDLRYELYDQGGNAVDPGRPTIEGASGTVYRGANFTSTAGYSVALSGSTTISGSATLGYGVADWSFLTGGLTANVTYAFGAAGPKFVMMQSNPALAAASFAKAPVSVGMWVKGDGSQNFIRALFVDSTNQSFQVTGPKIDWTGWKWVVVPVAGNITAFWGGANDGVMRGGVRCTSPFLLDSNQLGTSGTISLWGITIVGQK